MGIVFVRTQGLARLNPKTGESNKLAGGSIYISCSLLGLCYLHFTGKTSNVHLRYNDSLTDIHKLYAFRF
jgi:hypothetical protein